MNISEFLLAIAIIVTNITLAILIAWIRRLHQRVDQVEFDKTVGIYDAPDWPLRTEVGK